MRLNIIYFKYGSNCNNYTHIDKSLMNISQTSQCAIWGSKKPTVRTKIQYNFADEITVESSEHKHLLKDILVKKNLHTENVKETNRAEVYGSEYVVS